MLPLIAKHVIVALVLMTIVLMCTDSRSISRKKSENDIDIRLRKVSIPKQIRMSKKTLATLRSRPFPEMWGGLLEGDIASLKPQKLATSNKRNAITTTAKWPFNNIPYFITPGLFRDSEVVLIQNMMKYIEIYTCARFVPWDLKSKDVIVFTRNNAKIPGCWSSVGKQGGKQPLHLDPACLKYPANIVHELMHAIGIYHEQSRYDRDEYITINKDNIETAALKNFKVAYPNSSHLIAGSYDYGSLMHYDAKAFAKDPNIPTIITKNPIYQNSIGQRSTMSQWDCRKLNIQLNCPYSQIAFDKCLSLPVVIPRAVFPNLH